MKTRSILFGFILVVFCISGAWAQVDAALQAEVEALYEKMNQSAAAKDLDAFMSCFSDDFQMVFMGQDRALFHGILQGVFQEYDEVRSDVIVLDIIQNDEIVKVLNDQKILAKSGEGKWTNLGEGIVLDLLVREGGFLKVARCTPTDQARLKNIDGQIYKDVKIGFSFVVPADWQIFPTTAHPSLQGAVFVMAPDWTSGAMIGTVKVPGVSAKQAAEGDEALGKNLSNPETYELFKSGPIPVGGIEGYEIESKFFIPNDRERYRRRVYFNAGGLLYVLNFDAMPARQWDRVKDGFQYILDSFTLDN